jgi:hypothetical protein
MSLAVIIGSARALIFSIGSEVRALIIFSSVLSM